MKVYLAGFDVFRPDADAAFADLCAEARRLGLTPLAPSDCEPAPAGASPGETAAHIFRCNLAKLHEADAVIANLAPFRGDEPDSGTVFEVGFAVARQIPVVGYGLMPGSYADRVKSSRPCERVDGGQLREAASGMLVEDFGLPLNLMLSCSVQFQPTAADALQAVAQAGLGPQR